MEQPEAQQKAEEARKKAASVATTVALLAVSVAGGALLVWWALAFHPFNKQLWMVPFGLVVLGTPIVAWLALFSSNTCRQLELLVKGCRQRPAGDVER